jgi:pantothenate kinase
LSTVQLVRLGTRERKGAADTFDVAGYVAILRRVIWTAAGTADSVMPLTYYELLAITEGVAVQVR